MELAETETVFRVKFALQRAAKLPYHHFEVDHDVFIQKVEKIDTGLYVAGNYENTGIKQLLEGGEIYSGKVHSVTEDCILVDVPGYVEEAGTYYQ